MAPSPAYKSLLQDPKKKMPLVVKKFREYQVHEINLGRKDFGEYHHLFKLLRKYPVKFQQYTRMQINTFDVILSQIEEKLRKGWCNLHPQPILPEEQLVVTLRFLATGMTYKSLSFAFRMAESTISDLTKKVMEVLWDLYPKYMPVPTEEILLEGATDFYNIWNLPNCLGAIDVKHIQIKRPAKSGCRYLNYKKFYSITLQAVVDADYKFISIDVGGYGFQHDSTTFRASTFYAALKKNIIKIPKPAKLPNSKTVVPHFFVADGAYPLMENLQKPYPGECLSDEQTMFNYRLSRARLVVECCFGHLCQRWRIFYTKINCEPATVELIAKAACILHNAIIELEGKGKGLKRPAPDAPESMKMGGHDDGTVDPQTGFPVGNGAATRKKLTKYVKKNPFKKAKV